MHVYEKMYRCTQNDFLTATNTRRTLNLIVVESKIFEKYNHYI